MKIGYVTIALLFASTQSFAGGFNKIAEAALKANDLKTYFHELSEHGGSEKQCNEMISAWNQAIIDGANNYANQPDEKDFENAKRMCIGKFKHLNNAGKAAAGIVY